MGTTTSIAIRDRVIAVIGVLTPTSPLNAAFHAYRNESADFVSFSEDNPDSALRRFQVRESGFRPAWLVSNTDVAEELTTLTVLVAYPQNSRAGKANTMDRDRIMYEDSQSIEQAIGLNGAANFTSAFGADASVRVSQVDARISRDACEYLSITVTYGYYRAMP